MFIEREEVEHQINVLRGAKEALLEKNSLILTELSDQTLHCATKYQNSGSMTMAVVLYSLKRSKRSPLCSLLSSASSIKIVFVDFWTEHRG